MNPWNSNVVYQFYRIVAKILITYAWCVLSCWIDPSWPLWVYESLGTVIYSFTNYSNADLALNGGPAWLNTADGVYFHWTLDDALSHNCLRSTWK